MCPGEETIAAYAAGQLARAERDDVDSHVDTCSSCQELVAALAKLAPTIAERGQTLPGAAPSLGVPSIPDEREGWTPGGTLGRYVLLARLGAGGMGVVYSAYDPELDRRVAVKVLRRARAGATLRDEARAVARLAHPNVIAIHDVGEADGEMFIAMEHVEGVTMRDWLRTPRESAEILDAFVQAGRGLAAAHGVGLVHRDVKPSNIMIGTDGRARVLDFGLARGATDDGEVAGTPAYMAPEQKLGERVDARADQYAFALALAESLGIASDTSRAPDEHARARASDERARSATAGDFSGPPRDIPTRVRRALDRARSSRPEDRFASMTDLLAELVPPPIPVRRWVAGILLVVAALVGALVFVATRDRVVPSCARAGDPIARVWPRHSELASAFAATKLPFAAGVATQTIAQLDAWTARWRGQAEATCRATVIDKVQPASAHALRQGCLDQLALRLQPVVALLLAPDPEIIARASSLAAGLAAPERCGDLEGLAALPPPPEGARMQIDALHAQFATYEAALVAGRAEQSRGAVMALREQAAATGYGPVHARAELLVGRLEVSAAHYTEGIAALHVAAQLATAARDLATLADVWIELSKALGNDLRTYDEAELFDGYAQALIAQLPDRDARALDLAFARCNRNVDAAHAVEAAAYCEIAIAQGSAAKRSSVANAARVRLGHFQRMQGKPEEALATLRAALAEAIALYGEQHPDVAIAHHVLGIALIDREDFVAGIAELRAALAIRTVAFPGNNMQVAESLIGLGDALGASGSNPDAVAMLERGLAMLDALHQGESAHAANAHILAGMSLQELERADDALMHFIRGADIADRSLQHREAIAAMGLRLAAGIELARDHVAAAVPHLERAIRLLERGKAAPTELAKTQFSLGKVLYALPRERDRALAIIAVARAGYIAAGAAGTAPVVEIDAFVRGK